MTDVKAAPTPKSRQWTNPLFNDNKLKLGLFCFNTCGTGFTRVPERYKANWPRSVELVRSADALGLEAMVSASQWRGWVFGDPAHPSHNEYDPFTWCAGLGAVSSHCALVATFHTQLTSPTFVAKAMATIDHITGGRCGINIVAGSSKTTHGVFGKGIEDHDTRYRHTAEFVELLRSFWTKDEEFDHEGEFFTVRRGISVPRPLERPYPPVMNAGFSSRGRAFAARYADIALTLLHEQKADMWKDQVHAYRQQALDENGREIQIWTHGYVVIRDTKAEAEKYLRYYAEEHVDQPWVDSWVREIGEDMPVLRPEQQALMQRNWAAGGGLALVGTADQVAEKMVRLSDAGLSGVLLTAIEPEDMIGRLERELLPRLEQAGLRAPFKG
jgi:FMNH2-dependent dimethyl sulfone monooxygenase